MASLGELYPKCVESWFTLEGEKLPSVRYECVWDAIVEDGKRVVNTKAEIKALGKIRNYVEQDSGHVLLRIKGKGWFAIGPKADDAVKVWARFAVA